MVSLCVRKGIAFWFDENLCAATAVRQQQAVFNAKIINGTDMNKLSITN